MTPSERASVATKIRRATVDDADAIGEVHVASWLATYRGLMPDRLLDALSIEERRAAWRRRLEQHTTNPLASGSTRVWVVEIDGAVRGFASLEASRDQDAPVECGELQTIYLHPDIWGRGLGRMLHGAVIADAAPRWRELTLWVLDGNTRAIRFYEAAGWRLDAPPTMKEWMGVGLPHRRYRYMLRPPSTSMVRPLK